MNTKALLAIFLTLLLIPTVIADTLPDPNAGGIFGNNFGGIFGNNFGGVFGSNFGGVFGNNFGGIINPTPTDPTQPTSPTQPTTPTQPTSPTPTTPSTPVPNPPNNPPTQPIPEPTPTPIPSNTNPVINAINDMIVNENQNLVFTATFSDPDGDALNIDVPTLPSGMTVVNNFGSLTFSWTPNFDQTGSYPLTLTVRDNRGGSASESFTITVINVDRNAQWGSLDNQSIKQASPDWTVVYPNVTDLCSDPDGDAYVSVESWHDNFGILVWFKDLLVYWLNPFFVGTETVTLGCNNVTSSFELNVTPLQGADFTDAHTPDEGLFIGTIAIPDYASEGSFVPITIAYRNSGELKLRNVKAVASIPELGIRSPNALLQDMGLGKKNSETLLIELPESVEPGTYTVRITLDSGSVHRVVHRDIVVN